MNYIIRIVEKQIQQVLKRNKSVLLLGPRQTGKTTLLHQLPRDLYISFVRPDNRWRYEKNPTLLTGEIEALAGRKGRKTVFLDEVQKVPRILDVVQDLIDRGVADFILTGSSARKLRRDGEVNLLPGRIIPLRLDPLLRTEVQGATLEHCLLYGTLPVIFLASDTEVKEEELAAYSLMYLEEEVRAEALVRNLGAFARFLEIAAVESGNVVNLRNISREIGVAHTTVSSYFEVLEDCLIVERIDPVVKSRTRKRLTKASKYLFFDLGVRRLCAREGVHLPQDVMGRLLEQWVGLELVRLCRIKNKRWKLRFWRDPNGPEVDWVIDFGDEYVPVEVKWTDSPTEKDQRHVNIFLGEYSKAKRGYVICRTPNAVKLSSQVNALPWDRLDEIFEGKK